LLVDVDDEQDSLRALPSAVAEALAREEPQLAIRAGGVLVARLAGIVGAGKRTPPVASGVRSGAAGRKRANARACARAPSPDGLDALPWAPDRTVLITGGTAGLGALIARHLVSEHGVMSLVLAGRRGAKAPGAAELREELTGLGAHVALVACDVTDREQLAALLAACPQERPLGAIVHAAGVAEDALAGSLTDEQLSCVLAPKLDAAWHLHELTAELDLSAFVMFSSVAGTLGAPGMGGYAAANACQDALAAHRRAQGLPALSLAWGVWAGDVGMGARLSDADLARFARSGVVPLAPERGLELLDSGCNSADGLVVAARFDRAALRSQARSGVLPAPLRGLVNVPTQSARADSLAWRLAQASESERERIVREAVLAEVASVLGHSSTGAVDPESPFRELGLDSLTAVELRNRLQAASGLRLPVTVIFDHPTVQALSGHLLDELLAPAGPRSRSAPAGPRLRSVSAGPRARSAPAQTAEDAVRLIESMDLDGLVQRALQGAVAE
jgi:NADP-dependent 3-hydroxy acid dehydrogenase YdfG/acyl carrier protein